MAEESSLLEVSEVTMEFGGVRALLDVGFEVQSGGQEFPIAIAWA